MKKRRWIWCVVLCLLLAGCGEMEEAGETSATEEIDYTLLYQSQEPVNICQVMWQAQEEENIETLYQAESCTDPVFADSENRKYDVGKGCGKGIFYRLFPDAGSSDEIPDGILPYRFDRLDLNSLKTTSESFLFSLKESQPIGIDYADDRLSILFEKWDEEERIEKVWIAQMEPDHTFGKTIDLTSVLKEKGLIPEEPKYSFACEFHICPQKQVVYVIPSEGNSILIFDMEGTLVCEAEGFGIQNELSIFVNTNEGDSIFLCVDKKTNHSTYFCYEDGAIKILYEEEGDNRYFNRTLACCDAYGNILYLEKLAHLVSWNVKTGKRERLALNVSSSLEMLTAVARCTDGKVVVIRDSGAGLSLNGYSPSGPQEKTVLTIETSCIWDEGLISKLQKFERTHPGVTIKRGQEVSLYAPNPNRSVDAWYPDIAKGGGPDLMLVMAEEADQMIDAKAALELTGLIDPEKYHLQKGLLNAHERDGKQYYFPTQCYLRTTIVKGSLWDKNTWSVEEVLDLLEEKQKSNPEVVLLCELGRYAPYWSLLDFFIHDIAHSPFLDTETMTAHFDGELFQRVLQVCRDQDELANRKNADLSDNSEVMRAINEETVLIAYPTYMTFGCFSDYAAGLNEDIRAIGYPTTGESGNLLYGNIGLVVNPNTKHQELIEELIKSLYEYALDITATWSVPLRRDLTEDSIREDVDWGDGTVCYIQVGYNQMAVIKGLKKDGTTFKKEYLEVLDSCVPMDRHYEAVKNIVHEEAALFFMGQKSAQEVQKIIQNRVDLYLNENLL